MKPGSPSSSAVEPRYRIAIGALVVFAVALTLRLGHLAGLREAWADMHLFSVVRGDATHHWNEARAILEGDALLRDRVFWKGPGYSYFLAGMMALFGDSPGLLRWPLAVLGAGNCAALVLLARRVLSTGWSVLAGVLAALNGVLILYDGELYFPTLLISLNLGALWLLSGRDAGPWSHIGAGFLLGAAALVHPVFVLPAAGLALWCLKRRRALAAAFGLAVAMTIAPVTSMNVFVRGQPILISWNGGINTYAGNHPCFDQYSGNRTNAWQRILQTPVDAGLELEHERDRFYYGLARRQATGAPLAALRILAQKVLTLLSPVEYASNIGIYELREHSPVLAATLGRAGPLWWPFGLVAPPALVGLWWMRREPHPLAGVLAVWSLGLAITIVLSFVTARYRAPLVFFGSIWAAYAVAEGRRLWLAGARRPVVTGGIVALVLGAVLALTAVPQRGHPLPLEWEESVALTHVGRGEEAEAWVLRALERAPDDAALRLAASSFFHRSGALEREREQLRTMLALGDLEPDMVSVGHRQLARSWAAEGRIDDARREIEAALAVGVDETEWRGYPYYQLGLGPITACRLRLEAAAHEFDVGDPARGRALMQRVRAACPKAGRLKTMLEELEIRAVLASPRLRDSAPPR